MNRYAVSTFLALFIISINAVNADSSLTYFDGIEKRSMSLTTSTFTPTHPECSSVKKVSPEPIAVSEVQETPATPPLPEPVAQPQSDSDQDGVVDSKDECPETPKGYKVDSKGCPRSVTLHLNFASDSSVLPSSAESDITSLTDFMNENPAAIITIIGHTDSSGKAIKNQILSENRAKALSARLTQNGIAPERIKTSGKGFSEPVASNKKPAGRAQNRRIEIQIR